MYRYHLIKTLVLGDSQQARQHCDVPRKAKWQNTTSLVKPTLFALHLGVDILPVDPLRCQKYSLDVPVSAQSRNDSSRSISTKP